MRFAGSNTVPPPLPPEELLLEDVPLEEPPLLEELLPEEPPVAELTVTLKAGNELEVVPLLTLRMMLEYTPVCVLLGVPFSRPLAMLKFAQAGLFWIEKASVVPLAPLADG